MRESVRRLGDAVRERLRAFLSFVTSREQRLRLISSALLALACLLVFLPEEYPFPYALLWAFVAGALCFCAWGGKGRDGQFLPRLLWSLGPLLAFLNVEYLIGNLRYFPFACDLKPLEVFLNLVGYYLIAGGLHLLFRRRRLSAAVNCLLFLAVGLVESYFYAFRGRVLFPADLLSLPTAMNVITEYNFFPSFRQWMGILVCALYLVALFTLSGPYRWRKPKWHLVLPAVVLCLGYVGVFFLTPFLSWTDFEGKLWTSQFYTQENGVLLNFAINLRYSTVREPDRYDETVGTLTHERQSGPAELSDGQTKPNIIVIMNESFCDLSVLGVETSGPCTPYLDSLTENTRKGNVYVSVFAGHTANSEYEFLTGNSVAFLPPGTVAYQLFVRRGDPSLAGQLTSLGYDAIAMHPYDSSGWNRVSVYRSFGFDEQHYLEDFSDVTNIRDYCSDRSDFENVISAYERHRDEGDGSPLFLFNVTMQNHGDYTPRWDGLNKTVRLTGNMEGRYEGVDMYLSLARETDESFRLLIDYFSAQEEPTVILMFGDHQPGLPDEFYEQLFGQHKDTLEVDRAMCMYQIPYVLWANYDLGAREYGDFSLNYLSTVLVDALGFPKTAYQQFLCDAMEVLPVVTRNFCRTADGFCTADRSALPWEAREVLAAYETLQYNSVKGERYEPFFRLAA